MKQYEPCIQNDNNNNNIIIIIIIKNQSKGGKEGVGRERERGGKKIILFFYSLCFFLRSIKIRPQVFVETEAKLIYATRATRGHQNLGVSSNSMR